VTVSSQTEDGLRAPLTLAEGIQGVTGNYRDWRGHDVVDADGHKIGELEAIYVDTGTDLPSFGTVTVGMVGSAPARPADFGWAERVRCHR
jgi:hypothetical protein